MVEGSGLDWVIVRPPAVYGPGDKETLELFKMAKAGRDPAAAQGPHFAIHVDDLARLLLRSRRSAGRRKRKFIEPDDGRTGGWSHREFASALGRAMGRRAVSLATPRPILRLGAAVDRLFRGDKAKLTPDRAAYFSHPDWVVSPSKIPATDVWKAEIGTEAGLAQTASWYREKGWL